MDVLYGRNAVREALRGPRVLHQILIADTARGLDVHVAAARQQRVPVAVVDRRELDRVTTRHAGRVQDARPSHRHVSARLEMVVTADADIVLAIAVADGVDLVCESLTINRDGTAITPEPIGAPHGGRLHQLRGVTPGRLSIDYTAETR